MGNNKKAPYSTELLDPTVADWSDKEEILPDLSSQEAVKSSALRLGRSIEAANKQTAIHLFKIGTLCVQERKKFGIANYSAHMASGANITFIRKAIRLSKMFDGNEKAFVNAYDNWTHKNKTFSSFCHEHLPEKKRKRNTELRYEERLLEFVVTKIRKSKDDPNLILPLSNTLNNIRRAINRYLPPVSDLADEHYIQYYGCCSCGEHPPTEDGCEVITVKEQGVLMRYPMCPSCIESGAEPDYERVAFMYASYALNTEYAFSVLQSAMGVV